MSTNFRNYLKSKSNTSNPTSNIKNTNTSQKRSESIKLSSSNKSPITSTNNKIRLNTSTSSLVNVGLNSTLPPGRPRSMICSNRLTTGRDLVGSKVI